VANVNKTVGEKLGLKNQKADKKKKEVSKSKKKEKENSMEGWKS